MICPPWAPSGRRLIPTDASLTPARILFVSAIFPTPALPMVEGGAEIVAHRLAAALTARGVQVSVLRAAPPHSPVLDEEADGINVFSLAMARPYWPFDHRPHGSVARLVWHARDDLGEARRIEKLLRRTAPQLIHTHNIGGLSTGVWRAAARLGIPVVHTLHDYYLLCPRTTRFREAPCGITCGECRLLTIRRRRDAMLVGDVVGVSGAVLDEHRAQGLFGGARNYVVHNMVPAVRSLIMAKPADDSAQTAVITFGFLGRITTEKGVERLVEAFGRMRHPARLVFGGRIDDAMRARLKALATGRPIEFLGFVRPADFFALVDVLVVPSIWFDPLPTVILEAQMAGRPAIGARRGGIPEAIGSDEAGWLYDPDDPDALAVTLDLVAGDPPMVRAKARGALNARARFDEAGVAEQYFAIYRRAFAGSVT